MSGNGYSKHVEKKTKEITKLRTLDVFAGCGGK